MADDSILFYSNCVLKFNKALARHFIYNFLDLIGILKILSYQAVVVVVQRP